MTRLTVAVRVRPLSDREIAAKSVSIVSVENGKTVAVTNIKVPEQNAGDSRERVRRFTFDYCFGSESTQHDVYQNVGREVAKAIKRRFHSCILAYGQSSSGKTHTMIGDAEDAGLAPRLCQNIFDCLRETAIGSEAENLNATVSYLEIYNEKVRDLLEPAGRLDQGISLKVREHPKKGPYVQGLSEKRISDTDELINYLNVGNSNRTIASTNANKRSSRSHSVFTVTCTGGLKLRLVDLAGSERAGSRSHTTSRFREGANINKSLVALRNVISALADSSRPIRQTRKRFIPYRDSILTWLLKDTLSGNSKTILISTVSPSSTCYNETVNTLRFGQRAKQIIVQPLVNEDPKERTIRELRAEIAKLKELLALTRAPAIIKKECRASLQNHPAQEWEEAEEFDSGINSSTSFTSFEDDTSISSTSIPSSPEDEYPNLKPDLFKQGNVFENISSSEEEESPNCEENSRAESPILVVAKPNVLNKCAEVEHVFNFETTLVEESHSQIKDFKTTQNANSFDENQIVSLQKYSCTKAQVLEHCEEDAERNNYSISSSFADDQQLHFCEECEGVDLQCSSKQQFISTNEELLFNNFENTVEGLNFNEVTFQNCTETTKLLLNNHSFEHTYKNCDETNRKHISGDAFINCAETNKILAKNHTFGDAFINCAESNKLLAKNHTFEDALISCTEATTPLPHVSIFGDAYKTYVESNEVLTKNRICEDTFKNSAETTEQLPIVSNFEDVYKNCAELPNNVILENCAYKHCAATIKLLPQNHIFGDAIINCTERTTLLPQVSISGDTYKNCVESIELLSKNRICEDIFKNSAETTEQLPEDTYKNCTEGIKLLPKNSVFVDKNCLELPRKVILENCAVTTKQLPKVFISVDTYKNCTEGTRVLPKNPVFVDAYKNCAELPRKVILENCEVTNRQLPKVSISGDTYENCTEGTKLLPKNPVFVDAYKNCPELPKKVILENCAETTKQLPTLSISGDTYKNCTEGTRVLPKNPVFVDAYKNCAELAKKVILENSAVTTRQSPKVSISEDIYEKCTEGTKLLPKNPVSVDACKNCAELPKKVILDNCAETTKQLPKVSISGDTYNSCREGTKLIPKIPVFIDACKNCAEFPICAVTTQVFPKDFITGDTYKNCTEGIKLLPNNPVFVDAAETSELLPKDPILEDTFQNCPKTTKQSSKNSIVQLSLKEESRAKATATNFVKSDEGTSNLAKGENNEPLLSSNTLLNKIEATSKEINEISDEIDKCDQEGTKSCDSFKLLNNTNVEQPLHKLLNNVQDLNQQDSHTILNTSNSHSIDTIFETDETNALNANCEAENKSTIELIPLMDVTSDISKPKPLRRTFSMDQKVNSTPQLFSSTESLTKKTPPLRKRSVDRSMNSLLPKKPEVKSKIDSYRKPRSQIVAAVTSRLYTKVKKKEASTDTDDINFKILPKELSICSNARMRLQELSRKAVRASKRKNADTQTELLSVLRVKEISTDVDDLRFVFDEVRDADVETQVVDLVDSATNCSLSSEYKSGVTLTRTCGTSMDEDERISLSFAKYFEDYLKPKYEILGGNANPIFTSAVNINVNHNYNIENLNESVSEDSLEEGAPVNMCFPDLISNHNSLEQNALEHPKIIKDLRYASLQVLPDEHSLILSEEDFSVKSESFLPSTSYEENSMEGLDDISLETLYAPEVYLSENACDDYDIFYKLPPLTCKPKIIYESLNPPAKIHEAVVLKSIMKQQESSSEDEGSILTDLPDSLNYYHEKKKVRFDEASTSQKPDEHMFAAMTSFMKEVSTLMSNLTKVASKLDAKTLQEESYDLEFTINDVKGLNLPKQRGKVRRKKVKSRPAHSGYSEAQECLCAQNNSQAYAQFNPHLQFDIKNNLHSSAQVCNNLPPLNSSTNLNQNGPSSSSSTHFAQNHNVLPEFIQNTNPAQFTNCGNPPFNSTNLICTETQTQNDFLFLHEDEFPVNKYETLVESSCDRLEKLVHKIETTVSAAEELHKFPQPFSVNQDWVYNRSVMDDSSLESNQAFSDYGSLPRRKRVSSCSPSGYLRQLTSMRRQIVESSREELLNEAQIHL